MIYDHIVTIFDGIERVRYVRFTVLVNLVLDPPRFGLLCIYDTTFLYIYRLGGMGTSLASDRARYN
jgi:hypothetical protein